MATRLYPTDAAAPVTPTAWRGAWDQTTGGNSFHLSATKAGTAIDDEASETSANTAWDVAVYRAVSDELAAQTVSGTLSLVIGGAQSAATADMFLRAHAYLMAPDGSVRATLLTEGLAGSEFPSTATDVPRGVAGGAWTLTDGAASAGDRLVVELGYQARNTTTSSRTGELWYGGTDATDLTAGSDLVATRPGWVEFSGTITFGAGPPAGAARSSSVGVMG
jgi:hypothetical protein